MDVVEENTRAKAKSKAAAKQRTASRSGRRVKPTPKSLARSPVRSNAQPDIMIELCIAKQKNEKEKNGVDTVGSAISTANTINDKAKKVSKLHKIAAGAFQGYRNAKNKVKDISKNYEWNNKENKSY